jgi:hypothetical protein
VFYKKGQDPCEIGELKCLHEHETYWQKHVFLWRINFFLRDYGVTDQQVENILSVFKYPFVNSENLENLKIYLQRWIIF